MVAREDYVAEEKPADNARVPQEKMPDEKTSHGRFQATSLSQGRKPHSARVIAMAPNPTSGWIQLQVRKRKLICYELCTSHAKPITNINRIAFTGW